MNPRALDEEFTAFAAAAGIDLERAPLPTGFDCMLRFYAQQRAEGCRLEEDGDMLLFQWGIYDSGNGAMFEIDLTRQVILPDELDDDGIWQLHLTYRYTPSPQLEALGDANRWCDSPADLPAFEEFIRTSSSVAAAAGLTSNEVAVDFGCAG